MPRATVEAVRNISGAARVSKPYIERSQRLLDNGQYELAINPLAEGLAKNPENVSLLLRKALVQLHLNQTEPAVETPAAVAPEATRRIWADRS